MVAERVISVESAACCDTCRQVYANVHLPERWCDRRQLLVYIYPKS